MTEFTLNSYLTAGTLVISALFGSQDEALKAEILKKAAPFIAAHGGETIGPKIADGLDRIFTSPAIENYHWHVALATEVLFAVHGEKPLVPAVVRALESKDAALFESLDPEDIEALVTTFAGNLEKAAGGKAGLAVFRHGGV